MRWVFAADAGAGVVSTLLLLGQVSLLAMIIADAATGQLAAISPTAVALLAGIVALRAGLAVVVETTGRRAATTVMSTMRMGLVRRRLRDGGRSVNGDPVAGSVELATAAVQGVDGLEVYFARYLPQLVLAMVVPVAVIGWSAVVDLPSALIMIVTVPLIPVFMVLIGRSAAARSERNRLALVALSAHFLDVVQGLPTLRAFNRGGAQGPLILDTTDAYRRTTMSTLRLAFLSGFVLDLATTLSTALVAVTLGVRLVDGTIPLRPALTVLLLVPELYAPLRAVGTLFHASTDGLAAASQLLDAAAAPDASDVLPGEDAAVEPVSTAAALAQARTSVIELTRVTVSFPGRPRPALDAVDLRLEPGEIVAITGPSGAGKTTLGRVLLGLLVGDEGELRAAGRALTVADLDQWRTQVAWAPQHPTLLHGTVIHNLTLGHRDAAPADVAHAARLAGIHDVIEHWPAGYDTVIGNGGRGVSLGQRRRLGLARALLRPAGLLVLDEPTAHLDHVAIDSVVAALEDIRGSRTVVILTHDPALIAAADRRIALVDGSIVGDRLIDGTIVGGALVDPVVDAVRDPLVLPDRSGERA